MEPTGAERYGRAGRPSEWEQASQMPKKIRSSCRAFVSNAFSNVDPWEKRRWLADDMSVWQFPPLRIC